jgi:triacylglycerol lipase
MPDSDQVREAEMLTLAAIAYRGYDLILPEGLKVRLMREAMHRCLLALRTVKGKWALVWGPVSHPAGRFKFDDAAIYVAQNLLHSNELAIAIRGTNPASVTDWISGDFMVKQMHPWPGANADARVSLSTIHGLDLLRNLSAQPVIPDTPAESQPIVDWIRAIQPQSSEARNVNLVELLKARVEYWRASGAQEPLQIFVTGHSKGGMLSSALALWLAETQGPGPEHWSDRGQAEVTTYSFAAPTAGNAAFAAHLDNTFGARSRRIYNKYDIAPYAWADLNAVPALYGTPDPWLTSAVNEINREVAALGYHQVGVAIDRSPKSLDRSKPVIWQVSYQHLNAYLQALGLMDEMTAETFLNPLPL